MTPPAYDFDALRRLSVTDRLQLIEDLWESIAEDGPAGVIPAAPELATELDRRLAEHAANPQDVIPWEDARLRLLGC